MSRLHELIVELCPEGVKWVKVGNLCEINTGIQLNKEMLSGEGNYPVYNGGIYPSGYYHEFNTEAHTIAISQGGASAGFVNFVETQFWAGAHCYVITHVSNLILNRYLFFFLKNNQEKIQNSKHGAGIPGLRSDVLNNIKVPLPPLPVQQEIVRILDQYTAAQEELEAKLRAELDTRTQQYEYYRELALSGTKSVWEYERIGDICSQTDNIAWNEVRDSTFKYIDLSSVDRETHSIGATKIINSNSAPSRAQQVVITDDVIFGTTRPTLKRFCLIPDEYHEQICSTGFCVLRADKVKVLPKFLFHQISKREFYSYLERVQRGVAYPSVSDTDVKEFKIPIPPLAEQERIVSILDRLGRQINDLKQALQLELEARRKQYEYYRDQLLTFKELKA